MPLFGCACLAQLAAIEAAVAANAVTLAQLVTQNAAILVALRTQSAQEAKIMSALSDLQTGVAALGTSVSAEIAEITTALGNATSASDIEAVVASLATLKATVDAETATLAGTPPVASGPPTSQSPAK